MDEFIYKGRQKLMPGCTAGTCAAAVKAAAQMLPVELRTQQTELRTERYIRKHDTGKSTGNL